MKARIALLIALLSITFLTEKARGQDQSNPEGQDTPATSESQKEIAQTLANSAKAKLHQVTQDTLRRRVSETDFSIRINLSPDPAKLRQLISRWGEENLSLLKAEISKRSYTDLRGLLSSAEIQISHNASIPEEQWSVIEAELSSILEDSSGNVFEQISSEPETLAPSIAERLVQQTANEEMKRIEREFQLHSNLENQKSELRVRELRRQYELEAGLNETKLSEAKSELENERKRRFELAELMSKDFSLQEYLAKTFPALVRFAAVGGGLGILIVIGLSALGFLLILAASTLGKNLKKGMMEFSLLLKGDKKEEAKLEPADKRDTTVPQEELDSDAAVEFDHKPQLKEAADKLREQVTRDPKTAAVVLSNVAESGNYGEVVAIFDILGPDLARSVFQFITSSAKKGLQRAFYQSKILRPHPSALFNRINDLRAMLATTDVMMSNDAEKEFSQIVLAYPDEELATALQTLDLTESVLLLSRLPPEKMLSILRNLPMELAEASSKALAKIIKSGREISNSSIRTFTESFMNENKIRLQETRKYLQGVLDLATDEEAEPIIEGLKFDPRLALEVVGIRATIDDLWSQPIDILEGLFSNSDLEICVAMLFSAPDQVRQEVFSSYPDRKKQLSLDFMDNLTRDKSYRESLSERVKKSQKAILIKLTEMTKAGVAVLPSYEHMKDEVNKQEEVEKMGITYEDYLSQEGAA